jgi:glucosamine 6-phosphate synthetase-like amidotransferase/phosphosugar isomerase protein
MTEFLDICYDAIKMQEKSILRAIAEAEKTSTSMLEGDRQIVLIGCGDSYAAADYGRWSFLNVGVNALFVSPDELRHLSLDKDSVVIGITASGRSLKVIDALQRSKKMGATTIVLTDNAEGTASQEADHVWITKSGVKTYNTSPSAPTTASMAFLLAISSGFGVSERLDNDTQQLKRIGKEMIAWAESTGKDISKIANPNAQIYLISEGPNHVAAQIGMMKFNEFSILRGIVTLREEFRHHYHLSINDGDITVLISDSPSEPSNATFMRALTDTLKMKAYHLFTDEGLNLELPLVQAIPNMIALQMASYYTVLKFDPEKEWFKKPNVDAFTIY